MTDQRRANGPVLFAELMLVAAATAMVGVVAFAYRSPATAADLFAADETPAADALDLDDGAVADPDATAAEVVEAAATAMAEVTSVEFRLDREGAPIYIDAFDSLALDALIGQFSVPTRARAQLTITVDGSLTTEIGAVAIDDDVWISNPVTGDFETLPAGFDIDPSRFFDPRGGWQPLLAHLEDIALVGVDDRGGERYHVRGTAPAAEVRNITVDLVRDQDVLIDFWIHPGTALVTSAEFETKIDGATASWRLDLDRYGESFTIRPPLNVRNGADG